MFSVRQHIVEQTIRNLAECGAGRYECVAYWTGPNAQVQKVDGWAHPTNQRASDFYEVGGSWVPEFFLSLAKQKRGVRAQLHTHRGIAFHSDTDDRYPLVAQAGFISIVLPDYAKGQNLLERSWVGILRPNGQWEEVPFTSICEVIP